ncbi:MAG: hypothetical protein ACLFM3_07210 [Desulfohalobiaceae bacterium]
MNIDSNPGPRRILEQKCPTLAMVLSKSPRQNNKHQAQQSPRRIRLAGKKARAIYLAALAGAVAGIAMWARQI